MTRLIDVDALPKGRVEWEDIVEAPTVDAVPVDFIEKKAEEMRMSENPAMRMNSVILSALIRDWREK